MNRLTRLAVVTTLIVTLAASTATAQFVVHDPINYAQSLARYAQLLQQYRFWIEQARRLPGDMAARYRVAATRWRNHDNEGQYRYARPILTALNVGDTGGTLYRQVTDLLEPLEPRLPSVPAELRRRLATIYASIELADSVAKMAIHQVGAIRSNGRPTQTAKWVFPVPIGPARMRSSGAVNPGEQVDLRMSVVLVDLDGLRLLRGDSALAFNLSRPAQASLALRPAHLLARPRRTSVPGASTARSLSPSSG